MLAYSFILENQLLGCTIELHLTFNLANLYKFMIHVPT